MKHLLALTGLAAALSVPLLVAPAAAHASCQERRVAGTVIGGVGGALVGHALFGGALGTVAGGLGGAVVGHQVAGSGCHRSYSNGYSNGSNRSYGNNGYAQNSQYQQKQHVYYDQYGQPIRQGATPVSNRDANTNNYGSQGGCTTSTQSYYDSQGALRQQPVQNCSH